MTSVLDWTNLKLGEMNQDQLNAMHSNAALMQANEVYRPGQKDMLERDKYDVKDLTWADKKWPSKMGKMVIEKRVDDSGSETWIMKTEGFGHPFSADDGPAE